ncbi:MULTISPECIES: glycosyltransferase WbsX family protein [Acinetobacter calcoaceticus/baumannii complex]|uniref:glycosyltransferase WbsX family protein n=1 Tax=Acinetobacter calcoaceticus/baumannii complex TaxID=909768 RepID=UPI0018AFED6A|nr:glycoside hydrolase family 99-like domain-containing protein [Acinetobacter baumannii]MBF9226520.1 glycoside hydrolase family 99-like domain-containing protein [Acinetobacter baumannii]MDC4440423.1 glycoside hydrolase family 99-like domain-containing protein [Acinetobacter baumannii]
MKPTLLAYYLPQFHEVEENNLWWGKGFTEWTNVKKAKKYFKNHEIRKPVEPLGEYDLVSNNKIIEKQFEIAQENGVDGFLVWNYWFGNDEKILEKPFEMVLEKEQKVKYAFAWANHSWLNKTKGILLKEQKYLGKSDYRKYFEYLTPYFLSENYIKKDNKPIFSIFMPSLIPDLLEFIDSFNKWAIELGFSGIFWLAENTNSESIHKECFDRYFDSTVFLKGRKYSKIMYFLERLNSRTSGRINFGPFIYDYYELASLYKNYSLQQNELGVVFSGWDTSVRHARNGIILKNLTPNSFKLHVEDILLKIKENNSDIVIVKSWNEWAEGNILEPDTVYGSKILNIVKELM